MKKSALEKFKLYYEDWNSAPYIKSRRKLAKKFRLAENA